VKIPKQVKVGKKQIDVVKVDTLKGCRGQINYDAKLIEIARNGSHYKYTSTEQANTFWHELTHAILHDMDNNLAFNEKFVSAFSDRLDQAVKTARF
jgi:hypothetical protein